MKYLIAVTPVVVCVAMLIMATWGTKDEKYTPKELQWIQPNETRELEAIRDLHSRLDDDKDGQVDSNEAAEFVREELKCQSTKSLHNEDSLISLDELWRTWIRSEVRNWSCSQVSDWISRVVELPELAERFHKYEITGQLLPRIATNHEQLLQKLEVLGQQRSKLQLRAMDLVLFGPPPSPFSLWKDVIVALSVTLCVLGLTYAWRQRHVANAKIDTFLEEIREYEAELSKLRSRMKPGQDSPDGGNDDIKETTSSASLSTSDEGNVARPLVDTAALSGEAKEDDKVASFSSTHQPPLQPHSLDEVADCTENDFSSSQELRELRMRVWTLETQLETATSNQVTLQGLLQQVYLQEWSYLELSKRQAEEDVISAQKVCDKIKKKRGTFIGAFSLANSSTLEEAGLKITKAVNKMQKTSENFEEYYTRWKKIEELCGFPIVTASRQSSISLHRLSQDLAFTKTNGIPRTVPISRIPLYSSLSCDSAPLSITHAYSEPSTCAGDTELLPFASQPHSSRYSAPCKLHLIGEEGSVSNDSFIADNNSTRSSSCDLASASPQRGADESRRWRIGSRGSMNSDTGLEVIKEVKEPHPLSKNLVQKLIEHDPADDSDNSTSSESKKKVLALKRIRNPLKAKQSTL